MSEETARNNISEDESYVRIVLDYIKTEKRGLTLTEISMGTSLQSNDILKAVKALTKRSLATRDSPGLVYYIGPQEDCPVSDINDSANGCRYLDHSKVLPALGIFYDMRTPCLIIGPHGTGKTEAVREFCRQKGLNLYTVPCSLGLREHHFIGRLDKKGGDVSFKKGPVPLSMQDPVGGVLYLDELNAAEADVLLRMDEVLDGRKEVNIEGEVVKATDKWWCVATINPLDHAGTKELPNQILSRFSARIHMGYPEDADDEFKLALRSLNIETGTLQPSTMEVIKQVISAIRTLRTGGPDLAYRPSIRETIACTSLLMKGFPLSMVVKHVLVAPYYQWGQTHVDKIVDFLSSKLGIENVGR